MLFLIETVLAKLHLKFLEDDILKRLTAKTRLIKLYKKNFWTDMLLEKIYRQSCI